MKPEFIELDATIEGTDVMPRQYICDFEATYFQGTDESEVLEDAAWYMTEQAVVYRRTYKLDTSNVYDGIVVHHFAEADRQEPESRVAKDGRLWDLWGKQWVDEHGGRTDDESQAAVVFEGDDPEASAEAHGYLLGREVFPGIRLVRTLDGDTRWAW